jgi:hypothetical protein
MNNPQNWRELLNQIISDPQEKQRIVDRLKINPVTLVRWASSKSNPREDKLHSLLDIVHPHYRKQFVELLAEEFPSVLHTSSPLVDTPSEIPSTFYAHVLNAHTTSPTFLHESAISTLIVQQILAYLDHYAQGMLVAIVSCVPPSPGHKVRSMRMTMARNNRAFDEQQRAEQRTIFVGIESQVGHTISVGHTTVLRTFEEKERLFPSQSASGGSIAIYPLLLADSTAGCLYVTTSGENFFSADHLSLLQDYANLLVLAFDPDTFYNLADIELGVMPPYNNQLPLLGTFQQRVNKKIVDALREQKPLARPNAEKKVWQELEEELLQLALHTNRHNNT